MAPSIESVVAQCHKATVLGNKISIHMLEYVGTVEKHGHQFDELAHDFLETCRIMWSLEAGLTEFSRSNQRFPAEMITELEKKFRATNTDFQVLDHMLTRLLEYEKKGTMGKIQKGWRKMFADNDVEKMRDNLAKTREALRMSSLVFQWSLGDAKIDESVGIGYTGLAAALDRMDRGKTVAGITKLKSLNSPNSGVSHQADEVPAVWPLPPQPITHSKGSITDHSSTREHPSLRDHSSLGRREETIQNPGVQLLPEIQREPSLSNYTIGSGSSSRGARERVMSTAETLDRSLVQSTVASGSGHITEVDTLVEEMDSFDPYKVIRLKADPLTMPRWSPRNTSGADTPALRESLISAVDTSNHKLLEQLLDRGVSPNNGPDAHILNHAILRHDSEAVRILLLFGADPNAPDTRNVTPLYLSVEESFREAVIMLMKYGADANSTAGPESESPFAMSVLEDKFDLARILLTYGGDVNHILANGDTALLAAIIKKRTRRIIDMLLEYGSDANVKNREGHTPLFEAINSNRLDVVTSLLDHGANPNLPGPKHMLWPAAGAPRILEVLLARGADPKKAPGIMELATSINNKESVRVLLKAGVDPNAKKDGIYTPLCSSIRDNRADIFELLLANGADPNTPSAEYPAFKCVTHYRTQYLAPLVAAGADLNSPKGILETAVQCKNVEALYWLLDTGKVSPNDKTPKTGATPLTTAIRENRADLVDFLLSRGADPNVRGENWPVCMAVRQPMILKRLLPALAEPRAFKGVMEMAVVANQLESIKLLLKAGVSVEDRNGGVFSPLTTAIREDRKEIVHFLLEEANADVNSPGEHLPIVKALRRLHGADTEIVELLLNYGADPNKIYRGHNAYIQAIENGDSAVLKLMIDKAGVDLNAKDDSGMTIVEIAEHRGWEEGKQLLLAAKQPV
ncbi:ankyrin repeat-containing domain protein [Annulohypoxylon maeteangense]|uniref:ankyrin repeat-containing domain protein n=1 Tax=Annulohypoxylon maeteangense TaxID=1927788 RepID=UPI0020075288|nr:ankyrin repeat-containing domain protein [Annulohypoxylon maeteangense]KAI0880909.1 ankyrin repeat-containing domain protein [Annulohypoxylon maeteangense]